MSRDNSQNTVVLTGLDTDKTKIILDTECVKTLYPLALKVAKKVTFSTARTV